MPLTHCLVVAPGIRVDAQRLGHDARELQPGQAQRGCRLCKKITTRSSWKNKAPCSEVLMALGRQAGHSPGVSPHLDVARQLQQEGGTRGDASAVHRQVAHPAVQAGQAALRMQGGAPAGGAALAGPTYPRMRAGCTECLSSASCSQVEAWVPLCRVPYSRLLQTETHAHTVPRLPQDSLGPHSPPVIQPLVQKRPDLVAIVVPRPAAGLTVRGRHSEDCEGRRGRSRAGNTGR